MKFEVKEPLKIAAFWVSKAEACDKTFMASLKPQFKHWKERGYLPVVYESGEQSPEECLYMLMKHNIEVSAKKELSAENALT